MINSAYLELKELKIRLKKLITIGKAMSETEIIKFILSSIVFGCLAYLILFITDDVKKRRKERK
jgi:hypothetical protein